MKLHQTNIDTIVAQATPPGRGGIAVIRISGSNVVNIAKSLLKKKIKIREAVYTAFLDENKNPLDFGLALYFPAPNSFTGEDVLELHGHGSPTVVDMLIKRIIALGARIAKPGEFSERAFLNDKIDLTQAEAIADLIAAQSQQAARAALKSLQGDFSQQITVLLEKLIKLRMYVEAAIDFVEEEVNFLADKHITEDLSRLTSQIQEVKSAAAQGSLLREGVNVVITGEPNVGKSSLLNLLSGKDVAIVTNEPGTTRDVLRETINLDGLLLHIIDTAGLRETTNVIEQEGIRRAYEQMAQADLILMIYDSRQSSLPTLKDNSAPILHLRNKIDLINEEPSVEVKEDNKIVSISVKNKLGIALLKEAIKNAVGFKSHGEGNFIARARHIDALARAENFILNAEQQFRVSSAGELLAEDLRQAQLALSEITGEFHADDLLGKIFSSFCIGK